MMEQAIHDGKHAHWELGEELMNLLDQKGEEERRARRQEQWNEQARKTLAEA